MRVVGWRTDAAPRASDAEAGVSRVYGGPSELAAFLAGAGPYHYYGCGDWVGAGAHGNFSEHWMAGAFDRPLGAPLADAAYAGSVWTRAFASGTTVSFDARTGRGRIRWADGF